MWKTAAHAAEKGFTGLWKWRAFPQASEYLSHSFAILAVYAHSHNAYCGYLYLSDSIQTRI